MTTTLAALFALVAARLAILVLIDGPRLASMARSEHRGAISLAAVRGPIVDRNGKPLALSAETLSVYARPRRLLESTTQADRVKLASLLDMQPANLETRLARKTPFVWLARHQAPQRMRAFDEIGLEGVGSVPEYYRFYPESGLAAAVVGKAGADGQGLSGVELEYEQLVRGAPAVMHFDHDALGRAIFDSPLEQAGAQAGDRLELTIDAAIQTQAEGYLADEVKLSGARGGAAIVLDPFTGEVLAMANTNVDESADRTRLHNSGVQDTFEPGSTLKGIVGAIALDDHIIDTQRQIFCEHGVWHVAGKTIHDDSPRGWLDLGAIIEVSSNIGAAKLALALGAPRLEAGLAAFGIGRKTGIDLPGETVGVLRPVGSWRPIELADHGFGQGLAVTPIQLATAYAAIANGGVVMRPYVLKAAYDAEGHEILRHTPQVLRRAVSPETAHTMNLLLRGVVNQPDGTGHLAQVADFTVAGKTGTAQMVNPATGGYFQSRLVASFVGFVPARDPRLVVLVVLDDVAHGHFGGLIAAPVFSAIASSALQHLEVPPERTTFATASMLPFGERGSAEAASASAAAAQNPAAQADSLIAGPRREFTPDFTGLSLRGALALARAQGLNPEVEGNGYVIAQDPAPGAAHAGALSLKLASDPTLRDAHFAGRDGASAQRQVTRIASGQRRQRRID